MTIRQWLTLWATLYCCSSPDNGLRSSILLEYLRNIAKIVLEFSSGSNAAVARRKNSLKWRLLINADSFALINMRDMSYVTQYANNGSMHLVIVIDFVSVRPQLCQTIRSTTT